MRDPSTPHRSRRPAPFGFVVSTTMASTLSIPIPRSLTFLDKLELGVLLPIVSTDVLSSLSLDAKHRLEEYARLQISGPILFARRTGSGQSRLTLGFLSLYNLLNLHVSELAVRIVLSCLVVQLQNRPCNQCLASCAERQNMSNNIKHRLTFSAL